MPTKQELQKRIQELEEENDQLQDQLDQIYDIVAPGDEQGKNDKGKIRVEGEDHASRLLRDARRPRTVDP